MLFFFQAEDGIRDLVRSRGLGDVYKRQLTLEPAPTSSQVTKVTIWRDDRNELAARANRPVPVSYTHLTLPTSDLV